MIIQHNITAMNANRQLNITGGTLAKSTRNLSSGYKINIAADDAAGLSISEKMRRQIRGLTKASENSEDGISMMQVADGAMAEVHAMLDRCIELSVKAANGTNSDSDRQKIQDEIDQIIKEIDAIKERTKFNEIYVLKGESAYMPEVIGVGEPIKEGHMPSWVKCPSLDPANAQLGKNGQMVNVLSEKYFKTVTTTSTNASGATIQITTTTTYTAASLDFSGFTTGNNKQELYGKGFNTTCCTCNDYYSVEFVSGTGTKKEPGMGTYIYKLGIDNINTAEDLVKEIVKLTDNGYPNRHYTRLEADPNDPTKLWVYDERPGQTPEPMWGSGLFGEGVMRENLIYSAGKEVVLSQQLALQVGADTGNLMPLKLATISSVALGIDTVDVRGGYILEKATVIDEKGVEKKEMVKVSGADQAIRAFSKAKDKVSKERSRLGAYQNRLEHTVNNLDNIVENTTAAESQIRDTDMAKEMVQYSNQNILLQAGQSMLAQANQSKQGILSLIAA